MIKKYLFNIFLIFLSIGTFAQDSTKVDAEAFRISDISSAIEETNQAISISNSKIESNGKLEDILKKFNDIKLKSLQLRTDTSTEHWMEASLTELEGVRSKWNAYQEDIKNIDNQLTDINHELDDFLATINKYEDKWKLTLEVAIVDSVEVVQERIGIMISQLSENRLFHKATNEFSYQKIGRAHV